MQCNAYAYASSYSGPTERRTGAEDKAGPMPMPSPPAEPFSVLCTTISAQSSNGRMHLAAAARTRGVAEPSGVPAFCRTPHAAADFQHRLLALAPASPRRGGRPIPRPRGIRRPTGRPAACSSAAAEWEKNPADDPRRVAHRMRRARATHAARTSGHGCTGGTSRLQSSDLPPWRRSVRLRESRRPLIRTDRS